MFSSEERNNDSNEDHDPSADPSGKGYPEKPFEKSNEQLNGHNLEINDESGPEPPPVNKSSAYLFEGFLGFIAIAGYFLFDMEFLNSFIPPEGKVLEQLVLALILTVPMIAAFYILMKINVSWAIDFRSKVEGYLNDFFQKWSIPEILLLSLLAGFGEELLFRGLLQESLTYLLGSYPAVLLVAGIFGIMHWITPAYGWFAFIAGLYLGIIMLVLNSIFIVIIVHALYDFVALTYYLKIKNKESALDPPAK